MSSSEKEGVDTFPPESHTDVCGTGAKEPSAEGAEEIEQAQHHADLFGDFPEGGRRAWMVVLGATLVLGSSFGYLASFGTYGAYYAQHQLRHKTSSDIAWIGSIQVLFQFGSGLISGSLFDLYGARVVLLPASLSYVFSIMMTSLCKDYYQFILAQGVLGGIGTGFLFTPALTAVNQYFMKKRGQVVGIAVAGSSVVGVVFPIGLQHALSNEQLGFGWAVRIFGFVILGLLSIACVLIKERLPPRTGTLFLPRAFLQPSYSVLIAAIFFSLWGIFVPYFFIISYGLNVVHMRESLAFYLLAILNGASFFGRVIPGILADKVGRLNMLLSTYVINGILLMCWQSTYGSAGLIVWTAFFGFFSGAVISVYPACLAQITPNPQVIGTYMGQAMAIVSIAGLTGSPIAGAIINRYGFGNASNFAGASMLTAATFAAGARVLYQPRLLTKA